jgi:hypothetical protein
LCGALQSTGTPPSTPSPAANCAASSWPACAKAAAHVCPAREEPTGAGNLSSVGVLVERTSRLVLLAKMADATAASALAGFSAKLNSIAEPMRQSLTYDQGKELSRHKELTARTGVAVYFCDPHSPWQRGTCENTNGLLRQYLPKGTDLSVYSQDELDGIADSMNNRPRATHDWLTPPQVFAQTLAGSHQAAASVQYLRCCTSVFKPPSK